MNAFWKKPAPHSYRYESSKRSDRKRKKKKEQLSVFGAIRRATLFQGNKAKHVSERRQIPSFFLRTLIKINIPALMAYIGKRNTQILSYLVC